MKDYIKKYEKNSLIGSILMLILALILIIRPIEFMEVVIWIFGTILIINGIIHIISYFRTDKEMRIMSLELLEGIMETLSGILILLSTKSLIAVFPILLGVWVVIKNIIGLQISINLKDIPQSGWLWLVILSILSIILGIIIIFNPFSTIITITSLVGVLFAITEIVNIIESVYALIKLKN